MIEYYCNICGEFVDTEDHWKSCTGLKKNHRRESMPVEDSLSYAFPDFPKGYNINIQRVRGGYYVEVGCERFVFTSSALLSDFISKLLICPDKMTELFYKEDSKVRGGEAGLNRPKTSGPI
jgi:hypothetical protein